MDNNTDGTFIIIVTYNAMTWLQKCLQSTLGHPVVVVDNASTDGTIQNIEKEYPLIHIIKNDINRGFGQANNQGIRWVLEQGAKAVFLLNQDAYLEPNTISTFEQLSDQFPEYGILSPLHWNGTNTLLEKKFLLYVAQSAPFMADLLKKTPWKKIYEVPFVNAAAWFMPLATLKTVGGFDPIFFHYGEDDNYCQRLQYHNLKVGIVPHASIIHDRHNNYSEVHPVDSDAYFENWTKTVLIKWADINQPDPVDHLKKQLRRRRIEQIKAILLGKRKRGLLLCREIQITKTLLSKLPLSRERNSTKGPHYLY